MKRSILAILFIGSLANYAVGGGYGKTYGTAKLTSRMGVVKTGQTTVYNAGDDGTYQKGLAFDYTDNGDGTVSDNNTGLMWAQDGTGAGCNNGSTANAIK